MTEILSRTDAGLYCTAGDFYIDPWRPVERAVITHAHADHARPGMGSYLTARPGEPILRLRMGEVSIQSVQYGDPVRIADAKVSLHPSGHILGASQVRIEVAGQVWV